MPPAPAFRYRIDALRVDGGLSARPQDYADYPRGVPVGAELHAFVTAELDQDLAPEDLRVGRGGKARWPIPTSILLVRAPTVQDLQDWGRVRSVVSDCGGSFRPLQRR